MPTYHRQMQITPEGWTGSAYKNKTEEKNGGGEWT